MAEPVASVAVVHPVGVAPLVSQVGDDRGCLGRDLAEEGERVGLVHAIAVVARMDVVLVGGPGSDAGNESNPDAGVANALQWSGGLVPGVEVAKDEDRVSARRPHGELRSRDPFADTWLRAQLLVETIVRPLVEQVEVLFAEPGAIRVNGRRGRVAAHGLDWRAKGSVISGNIGNPFGESQLAGLVEPEKSAIRGGCAGCIEEESDASF